MKQKQSWFQLYPESNRASNLSIAGGAVRLLSLLLLIAAIGATLVLLLAGARLTAAAGVGTALIFLLDELGEGMFLAFFLWGGPGRPPRSPPQTRPRRNDSAKEPKAGRGFPSRPSALYADGIHSRRLCRILPDGRKAPRRMENVSCPCGAKK